MKYKLLAIASFLTMHTRLQAQVQITATGSGSVTSTSPSSSTNVIVGGGSSYTGSALYNTFIGNSVGSSSCTGGSNTFVGQAVGVANTSGWGNVFFGNYTGIANTTGGGNAFIGQYNAVNNKTGTYNSYLGNAVGFTNQFGSGNTFLGGESGYSIEGSGNTFVGKAAGKFTTSGSSNTVLGSNSDFSSSSISNATIIGAGATTGTGNTMALGGPESGTGTFATKIGIGTGYPGITAPQTKLHLYGERDNQDLLIQANNASKWSLLDLRVGTSTSTGLFLRMHGASAPLSPITLSGVTPTISYSNLALIASKSTPMMLGIDPAMLGDGSRASADIYIVNNLGVSATKTPWECIRINRDNGFVGIHTRTAPSGLGSGAPRALFHVNLTNPAISPFDPLSQGIRFEGLSNATPNFDHALVVDNTGNIAKLDITSLIGSATLDWHVGGNAISGIPSEVIGTTTNYDFKIITNATQRARFTSNGTVGNFEAGSGSAFTGTTDKSVSFGQNNTAANINNGLLSGFGNTISSGANNGGAVGISNSINGSSSAFTAGSSNNVHSGSNSSIALGNGNEVDNSTDAFVSGKQNIVTNTANQALVGGLSNAIDASLAAFISGTQNDINFNSNNSSALGNSNEISGSATALAAGNDNTISNTSDGSIAMGSGNVISQSLNSASIGSGNVIDQSLTTSYTSQGNTALGSNNSIKSAFNTLAAGSGNQIKQSTAAGCIALGAGNEVTSSHSSVICGEDNHQTNGHGSFIGGGHNHSDGAYNMLLGLRMFSGASTSSEPAADPKLYPNIMMMGSYIASNLPSSLTVGFDQNRTTVITKRGMAIQLDPNTVTSSSTYAPTANLEVEAGIAPFIGALPPIPPSLQRSNIRFHNLPETREDLPPVVIDPATGELFRAAVNFPHPIVVAGPDSSENLVQELKQKVEQQEILLAKQQRQIDALIASIDRLSNAETVAKTSVTNTQLNGGDIPRLSQNIPNPFERSTSIAYYIPRNAQSASISFANMEGIQLKEVRLTEKGEGVLQLTTSDLAPGTYLYRLIVDGKVQDSKKMIVQ